MEERTIYENMSDNQMISKDEKIQIRIEEMKRKREEVQRQDAKEFRVLGPVSLIYALIVVLCLYKNFSGVTNPVWAMATVAYMLYLSKKLEKNWGIINTFISAIIVLLGISNFVTGNDVIIFFNYVAIIFLIATNVMYLFFDLNKVNVTNHILLLMQLLLGVLVEMVSPFRQMKAFLKNCKIKKTDKLVYIIVGVIVAIPVFLIMLCILVSADGVFANVIKDFGERLSIGAIVENFIGIAIMFLIGYIVPYAFTKHVYSSKLSVKEGNCAEKEPIIAIIVTGAVSLLYILFSAIQIIYLFLGKGTLPTGYTYAEYAREGFFQLLFVSVFNAIMVLICIEFFKRSNVLKVILTIVSCCTFVMIASSAYRMAMYIGEYGLTFTRILVLWSLAVITLIIVGLLYKLFRTGFNLFKYSVVVCAICFTALSLSHVDYFIAKYNLNMYSEMEALHEDDLYGDLMSQDISQG